jgi:hypothetical protein
MGAGAGPDACLCRYPDEVEKSGMKKRFPQPEKESLLSGCQTGGQFDKFLKVHEPGIQIIFIELPGTIWTLDVADARDADIIRGGKGQDLFRKKGTVQSGANPVNQSQTGDCLNTHLTFLGVRRKMYSI